MSRPSKSECLEALERHKQKHGFRKWQTFIVDLVPVFWGRVAMAEEVQSAIKEAKKHLETDADVDRLKQLHSEFERVRLPGMDLGV